MRKEHFLGIDGTEAFKSNNMEAFDGSSSPFYDLFRSVADSMPGRFPSEVHKTTTLAVHDNNPKIKEEAIQSLLLQNARTILRIVDRYFMSGQDPSELDELTLTAVAAVLGHIDQFNNTTDMATQVHTLCKEAVARYVSQRDGMPIQLALNPYYRVIVSTVETVIGNNRRSLTAAEVGSLAQKLADETKAPKDQLKRYILHRNSIGIDHEGTDLSDYSDATWGSVLPRIKTQIVKQAVVGEENLTDKQREVLIRFFGLDGEAEELAEIGTSMEEPVTRSRVGQIKDAGLTVLRHPSRAKNLLPFLYSEQEAD